MRRDWAGFVSVRNARLLVKVYLDSEKGKTEQRGEEKKNPLSAILT